jgi:glycosyltransferase involved in cell wall biosynthesis
MYAQSDAVVALTHGEADWLARRGADRKRLHVIGLGPQNDPAATPELARQKLGTDAKLVVFIGQLHRYKGFEELLGAARLLENRRDTLFVFVGPDVRGNAAAFATAGPNVKWLGSVPHELRDSLLAACEVLCVPSSRESFGSVIVEAWSCGKPVIGGPAGATRELIDDGVDGFVVPQEARVIAQRLERILDDQALAQDMGCKGKEKAAQRYSWAAIAESHVKLYEHLLTSRGPSAVPAPSR